MSRIVALVAVVLMVSACGGDGPSGGESTTQLTSQVSGPFDSDAGMAPELIQLEPSEAEPGQDISISFPEETVRGVHFVLEAKQGDGWELRFHLLSDWGGDREPESFAAETREIAVEDIGISGPGPDSVRVPDGVAPGEYRVCTGNSVENICAPLVIR